jgi:hypothetical protein
MPENIGGGRALRVCDLCGGVDDHPRHVLTGVEMIARVLEQAPAEEAARLVRELVDTGSQDRHMDCCRAAGCPAGTCGPQTAGAEDLRGGDLLAHLVANAGSAA